VAAPLENILPKPRKFDIIRREFSVKINDLFSRSEKDEHYSQLTFQSLRSSAPFHCRFFINIHRQFCGTTAETRASESTFVVNTLTAKLISVLSSGRSKVEKCAIVYVEYAESCCKINHIKKINRYKIIYIIY